MQDLRYEYDLVGNVTEIKDWRTGVTQTQTFTYDSLDRLATAVATGDDNGYGDYSSETYSYDTQGRLTQKGSDNLYYDNSESITQPHAVLGLDTGRDDYVYDANGSMTSRPWDGGTQTLTYDYENRVVGVSSAAPYSAPTIFWDGFESGDLTAWSSSVTDGGDLSVNTSCALEGGDCLAALIDDATNIYVNDTTPTDETDYQTRFLFDPNGLTMANGDELDLFLLRDDGVGTVAAKVSLHYDTTNGYEIRLQVNNDGGTGAFTNWHTIDDDVHEIVVEWWASSSAGADDGTVRLWIDGVLKQTLTGIDSDTRQVDYTRLGATQGIDASASGTLYFDDYASWTEAEGILYDGLGQRVKTVIDDVTTIYVGRVYEKDMDNDVVTTTYAGGAALRVDDGTNDDVYWALTDHLGGASVIANTDTTQQSESRYKPWGETRYTNGSLLTNRLYTGQRNEADIGLYYYGARWYDPVIGRFVQGDPTIPDANNSKAYDRFAYVYNNPIRYNDPDGLRPSGYAPHHGSRKPPSTTPPSTVVATPTPTPEGTPTPTETPTPTGTPTPTPEAVPAETPSSETPTPSSTPGNPYCAPRNNGPHACKKIVIDTIAGLEALRDAAMALYDNIADQQLLNALVFAILGEIVSVAGSSLAGSIMDMYASNVDAFFSEIKDMLMLLYGKCDLEISRLEDGHENAGIVVYIYGDGSMRFARLSDINKPESSSAWIGLGR